MALLVLGVLAFLRHSTLSRIHLRLLLRFALRLLFRLPFRLILWLLFRLLWKTELVGALCSLILIGIVITLGCILADTL